MILSQSATTAAKIPPINANTGETQHVQEQNKLQLYNSLFGREKNKICDKTGLRLTQSLNYSLHTFLHLCDESWVLTMIDVESFDIIQDKYGIQRAQNKLNQIGTVIKNFSQNIPRKLKGFKCNDYNYEDMIDQDCKHDIFALLMYCHPQLTIAEKYVIKLLKKYSNKQMRVYLPALLK